MKHATSRTLYAYWNRIRGERAAPERGDIRPDAIGKILGDVFMLDAEKPNPYRVRLAGTHICTLLGRELRDTTLIDAFAREQRAEIYSLLDSMVRTATPVIAGVIGETADRRMLGLELLLLPLRHHGRTNARLLGSLAALSHPYWATLVPLVQLRVGSSRFLQSEDVIESEATLGRLRPLPQLRILQGGRP